MTTIKEKNSNQITVLASMLDWGLGHTTRSIPILKEFVNQHFTLIIAGTQPQINLLKQEIPNASYHLITAYNIRYSYGKFSSFASIIFQLPKIILKIYKERRWVKSFLKKNHVDLIFSDNRPGFRNGHVHSVYMTHQLTIHTGLKLFSRLATLCHQYYIHKFNECWVPDDPNIRLAGKLSGNHNTHIKPKYIGLLSRFENIDSGKKYDLCILLSGPEPQRTILENKLTSQLLQTTFNTIILRGLPAPHTVRHKVSPNITILNHLSTKDLNKIIGESDLIICRSGYSSIMDLIKTGAKAILVPTPGQGEQEYLAKYLSEKKYFFTTTQHNFSLQHSVEQLKVFSSNLPDFNFNIFTTYLSVLKKQLTQ